MQVNHTRSHWFPRLLLFLNFLAGLANPLSTNAEEPWITLRWVEYETTQHADLHETLKKDWEGALQGKSSDDCFQFCLNAIKQLDQAAAPAKVEIRHQQELEVSTEYELQQEAPGLIYRMTCQAEKVERDKYHLELKLCMSQDGRRVECDLGYHVTLGKPIGFCGGFGRSVRQVKGKAKEVLTSARFIEFLLSNEKPEE